jgi:DNA-binding response OmpR family regulator
MPAILVVDDEPDIRGEICEHLQRRGYRVHVACDLKEARAVLDREAHAIDYVLTDVRMPGGSGFDLVRQIREETSYTCRCVLLSKPFSVRTLERTLSETAPKVS